MTVFCYSDECRFNKNGVCGKEAINITYGNECDDFESYRGDAEWKKPYWKRKIDKETKQIFRELCYGKEIELDGMKFFVDSKSEYASVTEETTGHNCGERGKLLSRIEKIIEFVSKFDQPPLETLPIGEYDPETRKIIIKQAEQEGE